VSEAKKARLEFDAPQSCGKCAAFYDYHEYCCALNKRAGTDEDGHDPFAGRLPDCPLKIVPETPEGEPLRWRYGKADETGEYVACPHCAFQVLHDGNCYNYCPFCGQRLLSVRGDAITKRELKPCPFCGGEAKMMGDGPGDVGVICEDCNANTGNFAIGQERQAIAAWNRREGQWKSVFIATAQRRIWSMGWRNLMMPWIFGYARIAGTPPSPIFFFRAAIAAWNRRRDDNSRRS